MFTTDAQLDIGAHRPAFICTNMHQLAHPIHVNRHKRVCFVNLCFLIGMHEICRIIAADAQRGLSQIIGPE